MDGESSISSVETLPTLPADMLAHIARFSHSGVLRAMPAVSHAWCDAVLPCVHEELRQRARSQKNGFASPGGLTEKYADYVLAMPDDPSPHDGDRRRAFLAIGVAIRLLLVVGALTGIILGASEVSRQTAGMDQ